jgi:ketosteroid isomerase-like protein
VSEGNRAVLELAFRRWNAGKLDQALEAATEDVRWYPGEVFPDSDDVYEGKQGVRDFFASFMEPWEWIAVDATELEEVGDEIVVNARFRARSHEGVDVDIELGQRWSFRDGMMSCFRGYPSYREALEAARRAA